MKSKNILFAALFGAAVLLTVTEISAQGFYLRASGSYGTAFGNSNPLRSYTYEEQFQWLFSIPQDIINESETPEGSVREPIETSYGKGFSADFAMGYMISDYIGFEVGASYLWGSKTEFAYHDLDRFFVMNMPEEDERIGSGYTKGSILTVKPAVVFVAPTESKFSPYIRAGAAIGLAAKAETVTTLNRRNTFNPSVNGDYDKDDELSGGVSLGYTAALGTNFNFNDNFSLFAEVELTKIYHQFTKRVITKYQVQGTDELANLAFAEFTISDAANSVLPPDPPDHLRGASWPFGGTRFTLGMKYLFGSGTSNGFR